MAGLVVDLLKHLPAGLVGVKQAFRQLFVPHCLDHRLEQRGEALESAGHQALGRGKPRWAKSFNRRWVACDDRYLWSRISTQTDTPRLLRGSTRGAGKAVTIRCSPWQWQPRYFLRRILRSRDAPGFQRFLNPLSCRGRAKAIRSRRSTSRARPSPGFPPRQASRAVVCVRAPGIRFADPGTSRARHG